MPSVSVNRRDVLGLALLGAASPLLAQSTIFSQPVPATPDLGLLRAEDFGAVGDGVADDTDALNALFAAMQAQGKPGMLGGGRAETRHLVRPGEWVWTFRNNPIVDAPGPPGPTLYTGGKVVIVGKPGGRDAPLLSIHNDPQRGSRFVHGGYVGSLWFEDRGRGSNRHGLSLYGVEFMRFGAMFSNALQGDLIHLESHGDAFTADGWHIMGCMFDGGMSWNTNGWTFNNDSVSQVFNLCQINLLHNINGGRGAFRGPGSNNTINGISCTSNKGWAVDLVPDVGTVYGMTINGAELDGPEYGIRIDGLMTSQIHNARITHRVGEGIIPADKAWPREAIRFGGPSPGTVTMDIALTAIHRLALTITPATQSRLGLFATFSNDPTVSGIEISHRFNASVRGLTLPDSLLLNDINPASRNIHVIRDGAAIFGS